jgi:hypothetical protein
MKCVSSRATSLGLLISTAALFCMAAPAFAADFHHTGQPLAPGVSSGVCMTTAEGYSQSTTLQTTGSKAFTDVSGTSVSFTQGAAGCVEVSFSAEAATMPREILVTQVVLDGGTVCAPSDNLFASDSPSGDLAAHAMNYICPSVTAGSHTVKVQFRSRFGAKVALDYRTTIVRYAP